MMNLFIGLSVLAGFIFGYCFSKIRLNLKSVGSLRVDRSDPDDKPYLFLELKGDPAVISKQEYITLKVETENYISQ